MVFPEDADLAVFVAEGPAVEEEGGFGGEGYGDCYYGGEGEGAVAEASRFWSAS